VLLHGPCITTASSMLFLHRWLLSWLQRRAWYCLQQRPVLLYLQHECFVFVHGPYITTACSLLLLDR
jgi:hypothetical protein